MESDEYLIKLINRGDSDAFETLYYRYRDWVYNLAWRFTGNGADSLDVLQETFTYLLEKFPGLTVWSQGWRAPSCTKAVQRVPCRDQTIGGAQPLLRPRTL